MYGKVLASIALLSSLSLAGCVSNHVLGGASGAQCIGDCVNGNGSLSQGGISHTGKFSLGIMQGPFEAVVQANGERLNGTMVNGYWHGPVTIRTADGKQFEQEFSAGVPVRGTSIRSNGDTYSGTFQTLMHRLAASPAVPTPITVFEEGTYTSADGKTALKGSFSLADQQLILSGSRTSEGKTIKGKFAAPLDSSPRPAYVFAPVTDTQIKSWHEAYATRNKQAEQVAQQPGLATAFAAIQNISQPVVRTAPAQVAPAPRQYAVIEDNTGRFMSPFTSDGVAAKWVDKAVNAKLGSAIGGAVGAYAGRKALEQVPIFGGFLGNKVGAAAGRSVALNAVGGEPYMRETSDISFNDINEMAGWLVANHRTHPKFTEIMNAASEIYPELKQAYLVALRTVQ